MDGFGPASWGRTRELRWRSVLGLGLTGVGLILSYVFVIR